MRRSLSPEREQELEELLGFLEFHHEHLRRKPSGPPPEFTYRSVVDDISNKYGRSKALQGTRQAVNDVLEELSHITAENVKVVDEVLRAGGLVTLSELRRRYSSTYKRILKRGSIKSETEYYLVHGLVVDLASSLSQDERQSLQAMVEEYEG